MIRSPSPAIGGAGRAACRQGRANPLVSKVGVRIFAEKSSDFVQRSERRFAASPLAGEPRSKGAGIQTPPPSCKVLVSRPVAGKVDSFVYFMDKNKNLLIIVAVVIIAVLAVYFFLIRGKNNNQPTPTPTATPLANATATPISGKITCNDIPCIGSNFLSCTPAELKFTPQDATSSIILTVFGTENEKCHFQMNMGGHGADCFFAKENLNFQVLNQIFGNPEGQEEVVSKSCMMF